MDQQQPLVCPSHTTQYIVTVLIGVVVGLGASFVYFKQSPAGTENTYQAGFDAAKKLTLESPMGAMLHTPDDIRGISGTVAAISGNRITIRTQSVNPFEDPSLSERTVVVVNDTKIYKLSQKAPKVMQSEIEAFMKTMQTGKSGTVATPSEPFTRTKISVSDITVGDIVNVTAIENIKTMKEFSASEIQVQ